MLHLTISHQVSNLLMSVLSVLMTEASLVQQEFPVLTEKIMFTSRMSFSALNFFPCSPPISKQTFPEALVALLLRLTEKKVENLIYLTSCTNMETKCMQALQNSSKEAVHGWLKLEREYWHTEACPMTDRKVPYFQIQIFFFFFRI